MTEATRELLEQIRDSYATQKGWNMARLYIPGLMSNTERKNGWQLSEQIGENIPYRIQQFLYRISWDADKVRNQLRNYVCKCLGKPNLNDAVKPEQALQMIQATYEIGVSYRRLCIQ